MTSPRFTDTQLSDLKAQHPCDHVAGQWVALRRHGTKMIGPCPLHSKDPQARDSTSFECSAEGWVCATCADGGDVIKLVALHEFGSADKFLEAVEWLGGVRDVDPEVARKRNAELAAKRDKADRASEAFREREREKMYEIWRYGIDIAGTAAEAYLKLRGISELPPGIRLRCIDDMPYYNGGKRDAEVIHRGPAMLAPIVGAARLDSPDKFSGLHVTYIDLDQPKGKAIIFASSDEGAKINMPSKKVRGSKAGGHIELTGSHEPARLIIGEGIEKTLAVWFAMMRAGRDLSTTAFWTSVDLGNLGGKAQETVPHPTLRSDKGRVQRVSGPFADLASPAIAIPETVCEVSILGDGSSDRFTTQCAIARAAARFAMRADGSTRVVRVAWSPDDVDFDDMLRVAA